MLRYLFFCLVISSGLVNAEEALTADPTSEAPEMPMPIQDGERMEEDITITITRRSEKTIHEYRMNGKIYKIKIVPDIGPAYYYIDPDGDGEMEELRESDLDKDIKINQWTIFSW